jgi:hypothetical protein
MGHAYWHRRTGFSPDAAYRWIGRIPDTTVKLANLKAGPLDLIERPAATDLQEIRSHLGLKLITMTELGFQGLWVSVEGRGGEEPARPGCASPPGA